MVPSILVLAATVYCVFGQNTGFRSCHTVRQTDCYFFPVSPECGSNGVTYRNRCDFAKAHCEDKSINIIYFRKCDPVTTTIGAPMSTTPGAPPSTVPPILTGSEAVLDFFCLALAHQDCETDVNYVCGSDATTYLNPCEFEKARCAYREVHLKHEGNCTGDPFNP